MCLGDVIGEKIAHMEAREGTGWSMIISGMKKELMILGFIDYSTVASRKMRRLQGKWKAKTLAAMAHKAHTAPTQRPSHSCRVGVT